MTTPFEVQFDSLDAPRKVWLQEPASKPAVVCVLFLDAEFYLDRVQAPETLRTMQATGQIPPVTGVYLSHVNAAARHTDYPCNAEFSRFLATECLTWIKERIGPVDRFLIAGLSLSGLSAAFTALQYPADFPLVLCQSPSAWWNDEWLSGSLREATIKPCRFWISVGDEELRAGISHPPSGMLQNTSQLASVRRLSQSLLSTGHEVRHAEFAGGHDLRCWAADLPAALTWLLR